MPPINFLVLTASISSLSLSLHLFIQCLESQEFASASFFERFRISLTSFSLDSSALSPFSGRLFSLVFHSFFLATGLIKETVEKMVCVGGGTSVIFQTRFVLVFISFPPLSVGFSGS